MILALIYHLEEETKEQINDNKIKRESGAISDYEYEELHKQIIERFQNEVNLILTKK